MASAGDIPFLSCYWQSTWRGTTVTAHLLLAAVSSHSKSANHSPGN